jgi:hypothetical protein
MNKMSPNSRDFQIHRSGNVPEDTFLPGNTLSCRTHVMVCVNWHRFWQLSRQEDFMCVRRRFLVDSETVMA